MANAEPGKLHIISNSGKLVIRINEIIDVGNKPATIDLGLTPNDIEKVLGKDIYISWIVATINGVHGSTANVAYLTDLTGDTPFYQLTFVDPTMESLGLTFESETPNSTIWRVAQ